MFSQLLVFHNLSIYFPVFTNTEEYVPSGHLKLRGNYGLQESSRRMSMSARFLETHIENSYLVRMDQVDEAGMRRKPGTKEK